MPGSAGKGPYLHPLPALLPPPAAAPMPGKARQEEEEGRGLGWVLRQIPGITHSRGPAIAQGLGGWLGEAGGGLAPIPTLIPLTPAEPQEMTRAVDKSSPRHINTQENPQPVPKPPGTSGTSRQPFPGGLSSACQWWGGQVFPAEMGELFHGRDARHKGLPAPRSPACRARFWILRRHEQGRR